jgi:hypothetical protein
MLIKMIALRCTDVQYLRRSAENDFRRSRCDPPLLAPAVRCPQNHTVASVELQMTEAMTGTKHYNSRIIHVYYEAFIFIKLNIS